MNTTTIQQNIIEDFEILEDEFEMTLNYLMELGEKLEEYEEKNKIDENIVKGCQSKVWISYELKDGKLFFSGDSNTSITKGLLSLLIKVFSGQTPKDILDTKLFFVNKTGLCRFIGTQRSNGLEAMENKFKVIALSSK